MMFGRALALSFVLAACGKDTAPAAERTKADPPTRQPVGADAKAESPKPAEPAGPEAKPASMLQTGGLSEQEFAALHEHTTEKPPALEGQEIELAGGKAYLSLPEGAKAPLPAVVVIHEWWGLNDHIRHWADRLAADGYAALAVDLYDGKVATEPEKAMELVKAVDDAKAQQVLTEAHRFLASDPRTMSEKRGVIGWCFGGAWALQQAIAQSDLDAAVMYYGRIVTDPKALAAIEAPVLGIFGTQDESIPQPAVDEFAQAMKDAGKTLELHRYDAPHAFANPSNPKYDAKSAEQAWTEVRAFLAEHLGGRPAR